MLSKFIPVAVAAIMLAPGVAEAATIAATGGPKEIPPASFTGPQFVDSRGCVYMRAGYGGVVKWVPRIDDSHQVLCGYQPTMAGTTMAAATAAPVMVAAAPQPMMAPVAPQPMMVAAAPQPVMAPAAAPMPVDTSAVTIPPGYAAAWQDDRLNPLRGRGTAAGQAAMERVWTRTVPMRLQPTPAVSVQPSSIVDTAYQAPVARMASSNAPAAPVQRSGRYVQVRSFAVAANAAGAASRLRALGLPVATGAGRGAQVVLAGPFADPATLSAALQAARGAGFGDAFVRN
ncbi:MAG: hypothetical protein GC186_08330 [Rhodobacteraceae bacterium]|nr:hypothetical protein [Paracoccaceae bacterium]